MLPIVMIACTALAAGQFYRSRLRQEPVRIAPIEVTTSGRVMTDGMGSSPAGAVVAPAAEPRIVPPTGLVATTNVDAAPEAVPPLQPQAFPESGAVQWAKPPVAGEPLAMLRISDGSDIRGDKVIRLRDAFGDMLLQVYIRDQEGAIIQVPPGRYQINMMIGPSWYGPRQQFGQAASYHRGSTMVVSSVGGDYMLMPVGTRGVTGMTPIPPSSF